MERVWVWEVFFLFSPSDADATAADRNEIASEKKEPCHLCWHLARSKWHAWARNCHAELRLPALHWDLCAPFWEDLLRAHAQSGFVCLNSNACISFSISKHLNRLIAL